MPYFLPLPDPKTHPIALFLRRGFAAWIPIRLELSGNWEQSVWKLIKEPEIQSITQGHFKGCLKISGCQLGGV